VNLSRYLAVRDVVRRRRRDLDRKMGQLDTLKKSKRRVSREMKREEQAREVARSAVIFLEEVGHAAREETRAAFEDVGSMALRSVLGDGYSLAVDSTTKRNSSHVDLRVVSPEFEEAGDPVLCRGGGVIDLLSFALRVVLLELHRPRLGGPLLLDEPFKHVSAEYVEAAAEMVAELSRRFGRQYILVTHQAEFCRHEGTHVFRTRSDR